MTTEANPYQTPSTAPVLVHAQNASPPSDRLTTRYRFALWLLAFLYPVWLVGSFYFTWFIALVQLGHFPRPMLDDPKSIGGVLDIAYYLPAILLMLMPVMTPIGLAASFFCPINARSGQRRWRAALTLLYVLLCAMALVTLRYDPGRVVEWWFD